MFKNKEELKKALENHLKEIDQKIIEVKNKKEIPEDIKQWFVDYFEKSKASWGRFLKEPKPKSFEELLKEKNPVNKETLLKSYKKANDKEKKKIYNNLLRADDYS